MSGFAFALFKVKIAPAFGADPLAILAAQDSRRVGKNDFLPYLFSQINVFIIRLNFKIKFIGPLFNGVHFLKAAGAQIAEIRLDESISYNEIVDLLR